MTYNIQCERKRTQNGRKSETTAGTTVDITGENCWQLGSFLFNWIGQLSDMKNVFPIEKALLYSLMASLNQCQSEIDSDRRQSKRERDREVRAWQSIRYYCGNEKEFSLNL